MPTNGARGPVPNRSDQRRRRNKVDIDADQPVAVAEKLGPECPDYLDGLARRFFESLRTSGQAVYYTASDWAVAELAAQSIARFEERGSSNMLAAISSLLSQLAATEGDRRRLRIELQREAEPDAEQQAAVTSMADRRARMRRSS